MFLKNVLSINIFAILCSFVFGLYEQCNHVVDLKAGQKIYINSPYYPQKYPVGTSCRYTVNAPQDYKLSFKCNIQLNTPTGATRCYNEVFYFNSEGSELLTESEYFCGSGQMERKSFLNRAVISYVSTLPQQYKNNAAATTAAAGGSLEVDANDAAATKAVELTSNEKNATNDESTNAFDVATAKEEQLEGAKKVVEEEVPASGDASPHAATSLYNSSSTSALTHNNATITTTAAITTEPTNSIKTRTSTKTNRVRKTKDHLMSPSEVTWPKNTLLVGAAGKKRARIVVNNGASFVGDSSGGTSDAYTVFGVGGGTFSCLVEAVVAACDCGWSMASTRIAGISQEAAVNEFPAMAGVKTLKNNKIFCGAAIINHRYLLSAAHCFNMTETNRPELINVVVGEHDVSTVFESLYTRTHEIAAILLHEQFHPDTRVVRNDIALLRTRIPIEWNRSVGPACLPFYTTKVGHSVRRPPAAGQRLDTAGWGTTSFGGPQSPRLLKTTLDVISAGRCRRALTVVSENIFCTYTPGTDTCQYDSGGALYARRQQRLFAVGIVSYGYACASQKPSVNTKVAQYLRWIKQQTPQIDYCKK